MPPNPMQQAIDAILERPDTRILAERPRLIFAVLRYALEKRTRNPDGFNPVDSLTDLYYSEVWCLFRTPGNLRSYTLQNIATGETVLGTPVSLAAEALGEIDPKVRERLTKKPKTEKPAAPPISRW